MNFVTIGLGNFGASLAKTFTAMGHDVLGVDINNEKVEFIKDSIANTICIDACDPHNLNHLPLKEADVFVVCIGHDFGISVKIAALLKKFGVKRDQKVRYSSSQPLEMMLDLYFQRNDSLTIPGDIQNIRTFLKNNEYINY